MLKALQDLGSGFLSAVSYIFRVTMLVVIFSLCVPVVFSFVLFVLTVVIAFILAVIILGILKGVFVILKILIVRNPSLKPKETELPLGGKVKDEGQVPLHA